ncbi:hypothetical protein GQ457_08G000620 [Hibiscus cannabinus]
MDPSPTLDSKLASEPVETKKRKKRVGRSAASPPCALVSYKELPEYMKDNDIFRWHNETLNVWTHLLGFVLFLGLTMTNLIQVPQVSDLIAFFTRSFPMSGDINVSHDSQEIFMRTTSTNLVDLKPESVVMPHRLPPLSCHSHHLNLSLLRLDYAGITTMIITSFFPPIYYIFQCDPLWHFVYLGGITVLGVFTIVTLLTPALSTKKFRGFRALLFSSMALFGIIPGVHAAIVNWSNPRRNVTLAYELGMAMFYLTGTVFYVSRVPERFKPGWFDLAGHSHQIFHVLVVMGALAHYGASLVSWTGAIPIAVEIYVFFFLIVSFVSELRQVKRKAFFIQIYF